MSIQQLRERYDQLVEMSLCFCRHKSQNLIDYLGHLIRTVCETAMCPKFLNKKRIIDASYAIHLATILYSRFPVLMPSEQVYVVEKLTLLFSMQYVKQLLFLMIVSPVSHN